MPYHRRNLYILSASIFLTCVSWNQIIPFLPLFIKQMGVKQNLLSWVGWIFALQSAASVVSMPYWGKLGDKYGRKPMAIRAGLCLSAIYCGMALCHTPLQLAALRFLNGALTGFIPSSMALIATNTPEEEAPRAIATAQTAAAAGLIVGPAIGGLLASLLGYRGSMVFSGALIFLSVIAVWLMVQEKNKASVVEQTSLLQDFATALQSPVLSSIMLTVMVTGIFGAAITPILALHLSRLNHGVPDWFTGLVFSLCPAALLLTAHAWSRFGERNGYQRGIQIGLIGIAISALALTFVRDVWVFAGVFFVTGLFLAAINPSTGALICTRVDPTFRGRAYGMQSSATMVGTVAAPLIATRIGMEFGLAYVFTFIGIIALAGTVAFTVLAGGWESQPIHDTSLAEGMADGGPGAHVSSHASDSR